MKLLLGNCLDTLKELPDNSIDSIVTDPPYGFSFMNKKWDYDVPSVEIWRECFRVLKPGGFLLAFAGTRTQHRMAVRIEDAGFEIRDMIAWVYGSGFPKSHNIGKAVDKILGNERKVVGSEEKAQPTYHSQNVGGDVQKTDSIEITKGNSEFEGWGTALKPALEPITMARKPISEKNVAQNCLKWSTGGINIDGSRVQGSDVPKDSERKTANRVPMADQPKGKVFNEDNSGFEVGKYADADPKGRFPANLIHDGSEEVEECFPEVSKSKKPKEVEGYKPNFKNNVYGSGLGGGEHKGFGDSGTASRFFYCAKVSKSEREAGLEEIEEKEFGFSNGANAGIKKGEGYKASQQIGLNKVTRRKNIHPTVKPIKLMEYLVKMVTPKNGTVLDPFMGSGSTAIACVREGFNFVGCELDEEYMEIARKRINHWKEEKKNEQQGLFD